MKKTRAQLLWVFQLYLDKLGIFEEERRDRLTVMFLERGLSAHTEKDFKQWQRTNRICPATVILRTRGNRMWVFRSWMDQERPFLDDDARGRWLRLYLTKALSRELEYDFHLWVRRMAENAEDRPTDRTFIATAVNAANNVQSVA